MKRPLVLLFAGLVLAAASFAIVRAGSAGSDRSSGTWSAYVSDSSPERIQFSLQFPKDGNMGMGFERSAFTGLTAEQVRSTTRVPVAFAMRRQAGTISYEGMFRDRRGTGEFSFAPNPEYPKELERLGMECDPKSDEVGLFPLAWFDVSTEFIRSMQAIGYKGPLHQYVEFRIFKIDPEYVRAMEAVGFGNLAANELVQTKVHNVSPEYIKQMRAAGNDLSLDEYVQSRIFEVTPEFAAEMKKAGYPDVDHDTLVQFRIHGVSPEFISEIGRLGYRKVPADQLVAMRIHGVTPEFIRRVEKAGFKNVPIEKLVQMRIFDIDPEMIGALDDDDEDDD